MVGIERKTEKELRSERDSGFFSFIDMRKEKEREENSGSFSFIVGHFINILFLVLCCSPRES